MAKLWIKMYTELLHDRKIRKLSERDQLVWLKLLLLAGQEDKNGYLPPVDDIALELYMKSIDVVKSIRTLVEAGLLTETIEGTTYITNFAKRQETAATSAERVRKYRETHKDVTVCNDDVTDQRYIGNKNVTLYIDLDKDSDKEKELEADMVSDTPSDVASFWIPNFGKEAYRAKAFSEASGIKPMTNEIKRWKVELVQFTQAEISIDQMVEAIRKIRKENKITIGTPGSVFRVSRDMAAKKAQPAKVDYLEDIIWEGK